jgi:hypothetical protein
MHKRIAPQQLVLGIASVLLVATVVIVAGSITAPLDFTVYYRAAARLLHGAPLYSSLDAVPGLFYQYVPWCAWLFIPLALLPFEVAWWLYIVLNLGLLALAFTLLIRTYLLALKPAEALFLYGQAAVICLLLLGVGQITLFPLTAAVLMIAAIHAGRYGLAGLAFPLLLIKPQLVLLFAPAVLWRGGRRTMLSSLAALGLCVVVATIWLPTWPSDMMASIQEVQAIDNQEAHVWKFTTLPFLLSLPGRAAEVLALGLLVAGAALAYRLRGLPHASWLALVLALSLAVAPYAYAYDLPLLLPALLWLTPRLSSRTLLLWAGVMVIPILALYSSGAYLATVLVIAVTLWRTCQREGTTRSIVLTSASV